VLVPISDRWKYIGCSDVFHLHGNSQMSGREELSGRPCPGQGAACRLLASEGRSGVGEVSFI